MKTRKPSFSHLAALVLCGFLLTGCGLDNMFQATADDIQRQSIEAAADAQARRQQELIDRAEERARMNQADQSLPWPLFVMCGAGLAMVGGLVAGLKLASDIKPEAERAEAPRYSQHPQVQVQRYPVFLQPVGSGRYQLTDTVTGKNILVDVRTPKGQALLESLKESR